MQGYPPIAWNVIAGASLLSATIAVVWPTPARGEDPAANTAEATRPQRSRTKDPPGMKRLMPQYDVWIDPKHKRVVADGMVVFREGPLEMFACPKGTKEHESIIAVDSKAYAVHAALLAVGAKAGKPVQFDPQYKPATGTEVDIELIWRDADGKVRREQAQNWVRNADTGKALEYPWVFAGSGFWTDEATGTEYYLAESGDFICVSNFPSAMLDLPIESSPDNAQLLFEAFTENIPPLGTRVRMVLTPKLAKK